MSGHSYRLKLLTGAAAACVALSSVGPTFAQPGTLQGSWLAGPDGQGPSTIVGRIEAPRPNARATTSTNLLVSGWAADTTASGWAGVDGVEVWNGAKDKKESAKLGSGSVGLTRADVGEALGSTFTPSGFTAIVPSSALQPLSGPVTLYVYLHTPGKGTWYRTVGINVMSAAGVNLATGAELQYPTDPIVVIARPQDGMNITQKQKNNKFTFNGIALDRNAITDPNIPLSGPGCSTSTLRRPRVTRPFSAASEPRALAACTATSWSPTRDSSTRLAARRRRSFRATTAVSSTSVVGRSPSTRRPCRLARTRCTSPAHHP
jgi:hypothetical protein